jgi:hypothetical protein
MTGALGRPFFLAAFPESPALNAFTARDAKDAKEKQSMA